LPPTPHLREVGAACEGYNRASRSIITACRYVEKTPRTVA
jgi:hypothetical protein